MDITKLDIDRYFQQISIVFQDSVYLSYSIAQNITGQSDGKMDRGKLTKALKLSGLLELLGDWCAPVMAVFGLPGEAVTVLISTLFSAGGGIGTAAGLYTHDIMNSTHMSIVMPGIFLMGALIQYMGRILGVAGVDSKHYPILFLIGVINAVLAMLTMKWLIV